MLAGRFVRRLSNWIFLPISRDQNDKRGGRYRRLTGDGSPYLFLARKRPVFVK
jgi:hypothetical protein